MMLVGSRKAESPPKKRRSVDRRTRTAHHEAGHAVLSASINDAPRVVSINGNGESLGRTQQQMFGRPEVLVQVHLAGFAAEHQLTGRRSLHLTRGIGFAILPLTRPELSTMVAEMGLEGRDEYKAVETILAMGCEPEADAIKHQVERFYEAARASLAVVWPVVRAVANALLKSDELDRNGFFRAVGDTDLYGPVRQVQEAHGLRLRG